MLTYTQLHLLSVNMKRRPYDGRLRREALAAEATRRILHATVELHARRGALGTSHAMIAKRACVSLPTVYKYFPTRDHLIPACTGLVLAKSPVALDPRIFEGLRSPRERIRALAQALFRLHEYLAPWAQWSARDAAELPALARFLEGAAAARRGLIRRAVAPVSARDRLALADILLDWPAWRALTAVGHTSVQAAAIAAEAIVALIGKP